jgi:general secretion pathway protein J
MSRNRGFTLLELLIGLTLLGFLIGLLFGGFRLASASWDAVEARLERTTQEEMARSLIRRLVGQLQPMRWKKTLNQPMAFLGEPGRLVAVAPMAGQAGMGGLRVIELGAGSSTEKGSNSARLLLRQAPLRYESENFQDVLASAKEHTILGELTAIRFDYFGAQKKDEPPRWQESWASNDELPRLVRIQLASSDEGWAEVIVAPMVRGTGCRWDSFHRRCR